MLPLVIRADASSQIGTGHLMRMLALAQAWRRRGGEVLFVTAECPPALASRIRDAGFSHESLEGVSPGDLSDAKLTANLTTKWIVLDGYHFSTAYQQQLKTRNVNILCVDDFGHCENWACDCLLNQNLGSEPPSSITGRTLFGISFALLREEFLDYPIVAKSWSTIRRLLITLGGADPLNGTRQALLRLADLDEYPEEIRVIIGPSNPHREELLSIALPFSVEWKESVVDMPAEYAWADGIISAGGSSCWEWLYFKRPGLVVTIAENQEPVTRQLSQQKIAYCPGWPHEWDSSAGLQTWLRDPTSLINPDKVATLVDGRGADRVASVMDESFCIIRKLDPTRDQDFTHKLVNDPSVRSAGYSIEPISLDEHCAWLARHTCSSDSHLYIIESVNQRDVGLLRFHLRDSAWEIGIALDSSARGKGYAFRGIRLGLTELSTRFGINDWTANIRPTNLASKKLFTQLGFHLASVEGEREFWTLKTS